MHDPAPQLTDAGCWLHAPLPLQTPVLPHVPLGAQPPCGSAVPVATFAHVPAPLMLHARQVPHDPTLQHTPSTQNPLPHWLADVHAMPRPVWLTQVPPLQKYPAAHCSLPVQLARQLAPPQTYAPQLWVAGCVQAPAPLQWPAGW